MSIPIFFTTAPFHYTLKKAKEAIIAFAYIDNFPTEGKNLSGSKEGYVSNDKKSSGSKMNNKEFEKINKEVIDKVETNKKRSINVELHKKINERGEGYYFKKQFEKIELDIETKYKNIKAVNQINNGEIPGKSTRTTRRGRGTGTRVISNSKYPDAAAKDFAEKLIGRELTIEDRIRGQKITTDIGNGKKGPCLKCWMIKTNDGKVINFRPAGTASSKTENTTATVDIMHFDQINRGKKTEFKFLWNGEK